MENFFVVIFFSFVGGVLLQDSWTVFLLTVLFFLTASLFLEKYRYLFLSVALSLTAGYFMSAPKLKTERIDRSFIGCYVSSVPYVSHQFTAFRCSVFESESKQLVNKKINVYLKGENRKVFLGSRFYFLGRGSAEDRKAVFFPYESFYIIDNDGNLFFPIYRLKLFLMKRYRETTKSPEAYSLGLPLIFGEKGFLGKQKEQFIQAGTSHLLAISGMHVGIILVILLFLFSFSGRKSYYIAGGFLSVYPFFTGLHVPVVRASLLGILYITSKIKYLKASPINLLFFVGFLVAVLSPESLFSVSFQLSFTAVLGLILFREVLTVKTGSSILDYTYSSVMMSVVAVLFTTPVVLYYFGKFSLITIIATPVLVLLLFPYLFLSVFNLFTVFSIAPAVYLMDAVGEFFLKVNEFFADLNFVHTGFSPSKELVVIFLLLLVLTAVVKTSNFLKLTASIFIFFLFLNLSAVKNEKLKVITVKGAKRPSVLVVTPYGECFFTGRRVKSEMDRQGCRKKIHFRYASYEETTSEFSYRKTKNGYVISINSRQFYVKNTNQTFYP